MRTMTDAPDQTRELWSSVLSQLSTDDRITPQLHGFINLVEPKGVLGAIKHRIGMWRRRL